MSDNQDFNFGDIVENRLAAPASGSSYFVRYDTRSDAIVELTDGRGRFWRANMADIRKVENSALLAAATKKSFGI